MAMASNSGIESVTVNETVTPGEDGSGTKAYLLSLVQDKGDCMIVSPTYAGLTSPLYNFVFVIYQNGVFTSGANSSYKANEYQSLDLQDGEVNFRNVKPEIYAGQTLYILPL